MENATEQVLHLIREEVKATSLRKTARRIGVSAPFLGDVIRGNRFISEKVADAYGYERRLIKSVHLVLIKKAA